MDFLDFEGEDLYFDAPLSGELEQLLQHAADAYPARDSESLLLRSYFLEPENLTVLVALYRYYYYQHRYDDALMVSERALNAAGRMLGFDDGWRALRLRELGYGVMVSMGLTRFYLLALKASAFLLLRIDDPDRARERLDKLEELDPNDQFGSHFLRELSARGQADDRALHPVPEDAAGVVSMSY